MPDYKMTLLLSVTGLASIVVICVAVVLWKAFASDATVTSKALQALVGDGDGVRLATVCVVIIASVYLALSDNLNSNIIIFLSTIASYTLGGLQRKRSDSSQSTKEVTSGEAG